MRHIGLLRRQGAFGDDDDEHSSLFFSSLAQFPASTVATGRGCLELGSEAEGFFFAHCEGKEAKGYVWPGCV